MVAVLAIFLSPHSHIGGVIGAPSGMIIKFRPAKAAIRPAGDGNAEDAPRGIAPGVGGFRKVFRPDKGTGIHVRGAQNVAQVGFKHGDFHFLSLA
jgi:hypothetical protein